MCSANGETESLEHIHACELYPRPDAMPGDRQPPFPLVDGEGVSYHDDTSEGVIVLTNYRLFIRYKNSFISLPLGLIESVECRDIFYIHIYCKDARSVRCTFETNEACLDLHRQLCENLQPVDKLHRVFAFAHHAWRTDSYDEPPSGLVCQCKPSDAVKYSFGREVTRMGFDLKKSWRICYVNDEYGLCDSYPTEHIVPTSITDKQIERSAEFRACRRFPSVVWRDIRSGAVLARCSQPEIGLFGWREEIDELIIRAILAASTFNDGKPSPPHTPNGGPSAVAKPTAKTVLIMDARSYTAAVANRAKGGGCECPEYYSNCEIQFMGLANIHSIRKSFYALRTLCSGTPDQQGWLAGVDQTKWLHHISGLLRAALVVVNAIDTEKRPVLVHCSDGWDRTPQIAALAQLMLDPYYRTLEGFCVLIQREWLEFGHKFADRCGNGSCSPDSNERCPVFLQWLDCVHQLLQQFPSAFQFNDAVLVKLVQHTYSCLFGTFLCNTAQQRTEQQVHERTLSVWTLFSGHTVKFVNLLYTSGADQVLRPAYYLRFLRLWDALYLSEMAPAATPENVLSTDSDLTLTGEDKSDLTVLPKTRSCDDLSSSDLSSSVELGSTGRRVSDPNIITDPGALLVTTDTHSIDVTCKTETVAPPGGESEQVCSPLMNGNVEGEDKALQRPLVNGIGDIRKSLQDGVSMVHGSTDTLTGDLEHVALDGDRLHSGNACNGVMGKCSSMLSQLQCHVCTSTSDISDSHVTATTVLDHALHTLTVGHVTNSSSADSTGSTDSDSVLPHSTPSSTNPPTPADKMDDLWPGFPLTNGLSRQLDVDGLVTYTDPVQLRLAQIENGYQMELQNLHRQLQFARSVLQRYASGRSPDSRDDCGMAGAVEGVGDGQGEQGSVESNSGPSSDVSWEQVDEKDARMTLWVPDHAVTHCAGCNMQFWIVRRKHHCRNCGQVFCADCTNFYTPVPQQHLNCPVRVCNHCYQQMKTNGHNFQLDGAMSTLDCLGDHVDLSRDCHCMLQDHDLTTDCPVVDGVLSTGDCPNCDGWLQDERLPLVTDVDVHPA